jgi:hypothetical protein
LTGDWSVIFTFCTRHSLPDVISAYHPVWIHLAV